MNILLQCRRTATRARKFSSSKCSKHSGECQGRTTEDQPSPPTSTSPLPPHFAQWPLPPQELQEPSLPYPPEKLAPEELPLPWHAGQFPSPGESQSMQTWVDMGRLPAIGAILLAFRADVKSNK